MTPADLINDLKLPQDQIDRIQALKASFDEFEDILSGAKKDKCPPSPFHGGLYQETEDSVNLIAQIIEQDADAVKQALLKLFGITEEQFNTTSGHLLQIIALSALVKAQQPGE